MQEGGLTNPTGDAVAANERMVEVVKEAIYDAQFWISGEYCVDFDKAARGAIAAYEKAMADG
jgi:hypothetical protein